MSWNGATDVAAWQVLAGTMKTSLHVVTTTPRAGFETSVRVSSATFYEARPLAADGHVLAASAVVRVTAPAALPPAGASPSSSGAPSVAPSPSASR